MSKLPKFAVIALCCCGVLIFVGCFLAFNSNAEDNDYDLSDERSNNYNWRNDFDQSRLYEVLIPENLPSQIKEYNGFTLSFNKDNRTPNYVAWQLLAEETDGQETRSNAFHQDSGIEGCPDEFAYRYSGFDRGHLCPAADQKWSQDAMFDCFVMANMVPQHPDLNQKAWETLENKSRLWAKRDKAIWIVAGPIYEESDTLRIGNYNVRVPGACFKAILALDVENPRAIAFVYPNALSPGNMQNYAMSVDQLEEITGFDFFAALPDEIENEIEAVYSFTEWNK